MHQFSFLPYFPADDLDLKVNRLHLFNFWNHKDTYITDADVKQRLERICSLYVDTSLERLDEFPIAVIDGNYALNPPTDEQVLDSEKYANALSLCSIILNEDNNASSSDNYVMFQPFRLDEESIAYSTGSYFRTTNWRSLDRTKLIKPSYNQKPAVGYHFDELLFPAFANMIDAHSNDENYLLRVLEWFNYSCMNVEGFSFYNRIVSLSTAFEIFFDLPDFRKEDAFATRLETLLEVDQMRLPANPKTKRPWQAKGEYDLRMVLNLAKISLLVMLLKIEIWERGQRRHYFRGWLWVHQVSLCFK